MKAADLGPKRSKSQRETRWLAEVTTLAVFLLLAPSIYAAPPRVVGGESSVDLWVGFVVSLVVLLALNGIYIAAETSVDLLRTMHVRHVREDAGDRANKLQDLIDGRQKYATACLLASRLARLGLFILVLVMAPTVVGMINNGPTTGEPSYVEILPWAFVVGLPVLFLNLVVGELVPRSYASLHPHRVCLRLYNWIRLATFLLSVPASMIISLANVFTARFGGKAAFGAIGVAEEEIKNLVESAEETGEIESEERELIHSVLEFNDRVAKEIMTPRVDLDAAPLNTNPPEIVRIIKETGHSRIPLYEGTDDQIVGIVHAKDLLLAMSAGKPYTLRSLMRQPLFVPENKSLHELLTEMRVLRSQMAIIQDEFGGTAGIVTIEDIVEELVGDIVDEYDDEEMPVTQDQDGWYVSGKTHVDEIDDLIGSEFESEEFDTIGGLVFGRFGRQPRKDEQIDIDGYVFTVQETDGRRIKRLRIQTGPAAAGSDGLEAL